MNLRNKLIGLRALWNFDNRWSLIANRLFLKRSRLIYKIDNLEFLVDHDAGDHNGTRLCIISDIYSRFLPHMELGRTVSVFDLGANGGGFPLMLLLNGKQISKLVCVELNPNTFRRLRYNIERNLPGEVRLIQAAVCGTQKTFNLALGSGDISDSIYQSEPTYQSDRKTYTIEGRTFDDLFLAEVGDQVIDICKIDIEGAEYEVFASAEHSCLRFCRYLVIELHTAPMEQQRLLSENLAGMGFVHVALGDDQIPGERLYRNTGPGDSISRPDAA